MNASSAALAAISGLGFGLSLIVAIGAQNAFVLRQGIRREHVLPVVAVCIASDVILMTLGVAGFGAIVDSAPMIMTIAKYAGAAFLLGYAFLAAKRAFSASGLAAGGGAPIALGAAIATCLAVTWLNPHTDLDTVVLLGSFANTYATPDRWFLTAGAIAGSLIWFISLGFGARLLAPVFAEPKAWKVLDSVIALVMTALAVGLLAS
ncbi:LysE/ArgO family amino acid transporter [Nocardia seriolae]|uniref:Amino acid transporter n=1 Tax=Nocardia seriolae TaxID=37332 RepID=A0ABC9YSW3_9NOCA|nr:LysE/ArgO family amino acid transporter [Nocardia seriolae]APA99557.1 Lysine exporter protein [Nocardia seriolae]QOW34821.1 amino acid transporter [Nocardia seriolae]WKY49720.1 LysE/ArgO family amino acid transporter [Nocardia seriolae]WNJ62052.1 LysE/ArgO family amino acid transporter [Nocardia seriolae]BAW06518.1 amino acid transporter [Nocardia seriolae]